MRSQGKGRLGSQQDPGSREGGVRVDAAGAGVLAQRRVRWAEFGNRRSVVAGREQGSHPMVQLQPHLRLCVTDGSICSRAGGPLGGGPRASEGQRLSPGEVATPPSTWDSGGEEAAWACGAFQLVTLRRREMA